MKLVRIEHSRCQEPDGVTWCFAPDDWDQKLLEEAVGRAKKAYQETVREFVQWEKDNGLRDPWAYGQPAYSAYPDMLVKDVQALFAEKKEKAQKKYDVKRKAMQPFAHFLGKEGLTEFYDMEPDLDCDVYWGHQHGAPLDYRQQDPWHMDKQGIAKTGEDDE